MRTALERGQFFLVYQPIVRLSDKRFIGAEALLRWAHPSLGTLPPGEFIQLAEDNGLIVPLTGFVIEQACRLVRTWRDDWSAPQPFVSVNLSPTNIGDPDLVPLVESTLATTGLPGNALQLELTQVADLNRDEASVARLRELAALGVSLAVDNFDVGSSSFASLRNLPLNAIKLAGGFIKNTENNTQDQSAGEKITRAINLAHAIDRAHTLGLTVTAEQVETPSQAAELRAVGCDAAQGWHFAKALPSDFFSE